MSKGRTVPKLVYQPRKQRSPSREERSRSLRQRWNRVYGCGDGPECADPMHVCSLCHKEVSHGLHKCPACDSYVTAIPRYARLPRRRAGERIFRILFNRLNQHTTPLRRWRNGRHRACSGQCIRAMPVLRVSLRAKSANRVNPHSTTCHVTSPVKHSLLCVSARNDVVNAHGWHL